MLELLIQEYSILIEIQKYLQSFEIVCLSELNTDFRLRFRKQQESFQRLHRWEKNDQIIRRFYKSRVRSYIDYYNCGFTNERNGLTMKLFVRPIDQIVCLSITTFKNFHTYLEFPHIKYNKKMYFNHLYDSRLPPFMTTSGTWRSYFLMISDGECESLVCDYTDLSNIQLCSTNRSFQKIGTFFASIFGNFDYSNYKQVDKWEGPEKSCHLEQKEANYAHCYLNDSFCLYHIADYKMTQIMKIKCKNQLTDNIIKISYFVAQKKLLILESTPWKKQTRIRFYFLVGNKCQLINKIMISVKGSCLHTFYSHKYDSYLFIHNCKTHYIVKEPDTVMKVIHFSHHFPDCLSIDYDENTDSIVYREKDGIGRYQISNFFVDIS